MEDSGSNSLGLRLDIKHLLLEAQHRWLRPAEICEILRNYRKFHITPEAPHKPVSGSVFLFDRKALRYFRKDGHNWRKKKDGKPVKEAHEKLKVGSVEMLHCYYAHGEENENVQRRSYWMLEQDLIHIVFVHYLEVKGGNKTNSSFTRKAETIVSCFQNDSSLSFSFPESSNKLVSASADSTSPTSSVTSAYEDVESEENQQASSGFQSEDSWVTGNIDAGLQRPYHLSPNSEGTRAIPATDYASLPHQHAYGGCAGSIFVGGSPKTLDLASWEEVLGHRTAGEIADKQESGNPLPVQADWQHPLGDSSLHLYRAPVNENFICDLSYDGGKSFSKQKSLPENSQSVVDSFYTCPDVQEEQAVRNLQIEHSYTEPGYMVNQKSDNSMKSIGTGNYSRILKQSIVGGSPTEEGLKKADSFSRWIAKELGEVDELAMQSTGGISWSDIDGENVVNDACIPNQLQLDADTLSPSLCQDQLFSISDFSPNWAYSNIETEVLITGTFLKSKQGAANCRWSCMFGEVEVPAEVLADRILSCHTPPHRAGLVPFYITCSNRLACSEVREFEYRIGPDQDIYFTNAYNGSTIEIYLRQRLENLLSVQPVGKTFNFENVGERKEVLNKIISMMEEENCRMGKLKPEWDIMWPKVMDEQFLEKHLKEMLYLWLLHKVTEDGQGPAVLDEEGQGVLHLAAALGYNWVLRPTTVAGVSIDFRDVNGWTAIHWAAFYGREETVAALVSLGAAPGALTDPSTEFPLGRTPADLASANGHKGISGFLAESSLTTHLSSLNMNDPKEDGALGSPAEEGIQTVSERVAISTFEGDAPDVLSLKDSLAAVCNATQAAARIHQIFRIQSFQRKQFVEQGSDDLSSPDEHALSLLAAKTCRMGQGDGTAHAAAISIQKKYRGWKKRKEFLLIRQRIVKIQAHVRGHQVRKKYKPIVWSVGILEKVILRWKRKGSGLRGFRQDTVSRDPTTEEMPSQEDDYDFLKEGRKQTEERLQKALARVKSMAQYPEARAQYRRLLTVAEEFRETKDASHMVLNGSEDASYPEEELFDVQSLLDDDTFMSIAFE